MSPIDKKKGKRRDIIITTINLLGAIAIVVCLRTYYNLSLADRETVSCAGLSKQIFVFVLVAGIL